MSTQAKTNKHIQARSRTAMTAETNKAIIRRIVEEIQNGGNLALIDELLAPNFVNHTPAPGLSPDREGIKHLFSMFRAAFPDGSMTIEDMIAEEEKVVTRKTYRGTHLGEFLGIPPTGRHISVGLIDMMRVVDGKVVEHWSVGDDLGMLQQLGVIPLPLGD
jgi:steroid delta-isomerase-like uncharacterized protein